MKTTATSTTSALYIFAVFLSTRAMFFFGASKQIRGIIGIKVVLCLDTLLLKTER